MDCTEIKVEMAEGGLLDPLVIIEEGDVTNGAIEKGAARSSLAIAQSCGEESALKKKEEHTGEDKNEDDVAAKMCSERQSLEKQQTNAEDDPTGEVVVNEEDKEEKDKPEETGSMSDGQNRGDSEREGQTNEVMRINENPEDEVTRDDPQVDTERLNSSEQQPEGTKSQEEDPKQVCGLFLFYCGISPEIIMTRLAGHAVNKVFVCSVLDFTNQPPFTLQDNLVMEKQQVSFCYRACGST